MFSPVPLPKSSSARSPAKTISRNAAGSSRNIVCASCAREALTSWADFPAAPKYARSKSSSTRARSAAARASLTPPGYNSFSARASSGVANAVRYAAASCLACCTPFQNSRASSPLQGSFICSASHGGASTGPATLGCALFSTPCGGCVAPASSRLRSV